MKKIGVFLLILGAAAALSACSHGKSKDVSGASMPEEIYASPDYNMYRNAKVGVFPFMSPEYARGAGNSAASVFCRQLEKNRVFSAVHLEADVPPQAIAEIAKAKRYDLVITGAVLYWFEGSTLEPSRVEQEVTVFKPSSKGDRILWRARLMETGWPVQPKDYLLGQTHAVPAPSAMTLVQKNAGKFCKMLLAGR
ncbi:hypothetical protein SAMN02745216_03390 [Desulfatibacillum alkenivorans DSM 16219]|uniref:Lipoprotein n=1 Tax=Desulfatibacillum alkenivorans DSM 16219 TaxID=1121393 RepID=A0A1M6S4A6_9BACT|nr:lipoprotein [Desulfatibacillum alkenivorans]SHK39674.1 hypothetical protein SAMN02745216_03390 [Desulfatibacillum alkenivorans DSM 16219]